MSLAPLDDPVYEPQHPPINGEVPDVVTKWGPRSQLRWFTRFNTQLAPQHGDVWGRYHVHSEHHRGPCCISCNAEYVHGTGVMMDDYCCCKGARALREQE